MTKPTVPALLQPHLKAFLPLLNKETLIDVVLGMNLELTNEKANVATLKQEVAGFSAAADIAANRSDREILNEDMEDGEVLAYVRDCVPQYMVEAFFPQLKEVAALKQEVAAAKTELEARSAEFEEKYYGLDLQHRKLEKRNKHLEERFAVVTMRLAQAEAALGVFCPDESCNDEWDAWSDEAIASRKSMDILLGDKPTAQEWIDWAEEDKQRAKCDEANASRETLTRIFLTKTLD